MSVQDAGNARAAETAATDGDGQNDLGDDEAFAPRVMPLLEEEIAKALAERGQTQAFQRFAAYAAQMLQRTSGPRTGSEITGNCRLNWYEQLMRRPVEAAAEAERFSRQLHAAVIDGDADLLSLIGSRLDIKLPNSPSRETIDTPEAAVEAISRAIELARSHYRATMAPLSQQELSHLQRNLYAVFTTQNPHGHTLQNRGLGRQLLDTMEKIDRQAMIAATMALMPLSERSLRRQLLALPDDEHVPVDGVKGDIVRRIATSAGDVIIGGRGKNIYQLDKLPNVCAIVDLGGDDEYREGSVSPRRPVLVLLDLDGNDTYTATQEACQGGAILGLSMLVDHAGNDVYRAKDVSQGSCIGGVGILIDYEGDDTYVGLRRVQGQALAGIGILIDRAGNDQYRAAMWAQGFGGPLGFGLLDDLAGNDRYYAGGLYLDSYDETPGYEGWAQGVGAGLRQVANGGIGVILDGGGDDTYEYDYLAHGGGYWLGVGIARDFGGNDRRLGATQRTFDGGPRREPSYQRFSNGFGCHYAMGFCFDDAGDDTYGGTIMGLGFAWDVSVGVLCDFAGNDRYEATGSQTQGSAGQAGLGALFDWEGRDVYVGQGQGNAPSGISYHSLPNCGGNFAFLVDYGGQDQYGCRAANNATTRRGSPGGFIIDRPKQEELSARPQDSAAASPK